MEKNQIYDFLIKELPEEQVKINEPMKKHTNFKIGGNADFYVVAKEIKQIQMVLKLAKQYKIPLTILGNGSNVLVGDKGIRGIVLKVGIDQFEIRKVALPYVQIASQSHGPRKLNLVAPEKSGDFSRAIKKEKEYAFITVGAGVPLGKIAYTLLKEEIEGFEFAAGIPGSIGGAIRMNAGAYGGEMKDCIHTVTYLTQDGELKEFSNQECKFSYRHSIFCDKPLIIVKAELQLPYGNKEEIQAKMEEYAQSRKEKQPLQYPSAGSTFKRGSDFITAKLIDECGLKGYTVGGAQVSTLHAGFVINTGNATAKDVMSVIEHIKQTVLNQTGKQIELEIELLGEFELEGS